jgi:hypothetical protein
MEITVFFYPHFDQQTEENNPADKHDPSLLRLNSVDKLIGYCDSLYGLTTIAQNDSGTYANIVGRVIRYRFYHGYSWYHFGSNYVATLLAPLLNKNLSAIVVPDDILKYPHAACSQQSIVGMKVLMEKGYDVRPVGFYDSTVGGHFCYEIRYDNDWHFYDPNREPEEKVLNSLNRPGIRYLNQHPEVLLAAYPKDSQQLVLSLYRTYKIGKEGKLPGSNARVFQMVTKFLSYTLWFFLALLYFYLNIKFFSKKE